jgi:hypothetical protein
VVKVLTGTELQAVDEHAGNHRAAELASALHQGNMAAVQSAHGRNKGRASLTAQQGM